MKKSEAEQAIRHLCSEWGRLRGVVPDPDSQPDFYEFMSWLKANYPECLKFRSTTPVSYDVELWFDQEFKQTWRN